MSSIKFFENTHVRSQWDAEREAKLREGVAKAYADFLATLNK